jgi:hypothetical protein
MPSAAVAVRAHNTDFVPAARFDRGLQFLQFGKPLLRGIRDFAVQQVNHDHAGDIKKSQADRADEAVSPLRSNDDAIALAFDVDIARGFQADGSRSFKAESCLACRRGRKAEKHSFCVFLLFSRFESLPLDVGCHLPVPKRTMPLAILGTLTHPPESKGL